MKIIIKIFITFFTCQLLSLNAFSAKIYNSEHPADLVGTWEYDYKENSPVKYALTSLKSDGTFTSIATFETPKGEITIEVIGTWKVENGYMIQTITRSSELGPPKGYTTKDKIVDVTEKEYIFITEKGEKKTRYRRPNQSLEVTVLADARPAPQL